MKLNVTPRLPSADHALVREFKDHAQQVNSLSEGRIEAVYNALPAAPTAGSYAQGDKVWNSAPVELGTTPNKYVVLGWVNVAGGEPGTFVPMRVLTGN